MGRRLFSGVLLVVCVTACRGGFNLLSGEEPLPDDIGDTNVLNCAEPTRFDLGQVDFNGLSATPTPTGFALVALDIENKLRGWTFAWNEAAELVPAASNVVIGTDGTDAMGIAAVGSNLIVPYQYTAPGTPMSLGTQIHALAADLTPVIAATPREGLWVGDNPIAVSGTSAAKLAMINFETDSIGTAVVARHLDANGLDDGAKVTLVDSSANVVYAWLATGKDGYVLTYTSASTNPDSSWVVRFDESFHRIAGPTQTSTGAQGYVVAGSVGWSRSDDRYLVSWFEKNAENDDDVWVQILDGNLLPITQPQLIIADGIYPRIAADQAGFHLVWITKNTDPWSVTATTITSTGQISTPAALDRQRGWPGGHSMIERNGQAVLVWADEVNGLVDLWLHPLCD